MQKSQSQTSKIENIRHSLAHILAMAVLKKFPGTKLGIGPTIENGFYYDFDLNADKRGLNTDKHGRKKTKTGSKSIPTITDADLPEIEEEMKKLISQNLEFSGEKITAVEAKKLFKDQPFKIELIKDFVKEKKPLTVYSTCPADKKNGVHNSSSLSRAESRDIIHNSCFTDLCRGGHAANTSGINPEAFKLVKIAGAYWKGDEKNEQLTRVYGAAFETKEELDKYLAFLEEARKRDHKKLGPELDLFVFSELVGPGLPLWTPKGTILRNILDDFVWKLRKEKGYEQVDIPHITKKDLYETSGHWEKFKNELFKITTREGHIFALKPMNCPHHTQIFARKLWSYKELPQRYANTTKVYRDEQTGELAGLSRVRSITQDDAHVFCRETQIQDEVLNIWDIIAVFYEKAGFTLSVRLSLHDPAESQKYLGDKTIWKKSEDILREAAKAKNAKIEEAVGEAAFYGPKIDFMAHDSLGREWQVATIQLDMNMPGRFNLAYINEKGEKETPTMIHAAIMGSIERYLSILIEHYAGAFPLWLAPVQIAILAMNDEIMDYCEKVASKLKEKGLRYVVDTRSETLGKKIRESEMQKIPYLVIIGKKEAESGTVSIRKHKEGDLGKMTIEEFLSKIGTENKNL